MSLLQVDATQARKILSRRTPEPLEIRILMLFKTPLDESILMGWEFEEILADGNIDKSHVQKIINRLISEKILLLLFIFQSTGVFFNKTLPACVV